MNAVRPKTIDIVGSRGYPSYYGGYETIVRRIAPYLADAGWNVRVWARHGAVVEDDPLLDPRIETIYSPGFETKSLSTLSYGATATAGAAWNKPDVALVCNVANGFWLPALRARGVPTLVHVDGVEWERDKWGPAARKIFVAGAHMTARFATELVHDSAILNERWQREFGAAPGTVIYHGGDIPADELPVEDGLEHGKYVLAVARFVPENTIGEFLEAAAALAQRHDVVLVGSSGYGGPLDERAERLAQELPRFRWLGHVSDQQQLTSLWQHTGAYFHGHSVGGTNPSLVQAMALGAPVVARDNGYNREVLGDDGGVFVSPDAAVIADALEKMLADDPLRARLREQGVQRAKSVNDWDAIGAEYVALFDRFVRR